jgi:hypothetical protein
MEDEAPKSRLELYYNVFSCLMAAGWLCASFNWHDPWRLANVPVFLILGSYPWAKAAILLSERLGRNTAAFSATITMLPLATLMIFFALVSDAGWKISLACSAGVFMILGVCLGIQEILHRFSRRDAD